MTQASLPDLDAELKRLLTQRENLEKKRSAIRAEELKILADAFARKLALAGFSVKEGITALKPYAHVKLEGPLGAAQNRPVHALNLAPKTGPAARRTDDLQSRAEEVLGSDAQRWLRQPHALLGGQSPEQMAALPGGLNKVHALLVAYARGA